MADLSQTYSVSTGATVLAEDHNSHQAALLAINNELGLFAAADANYGEETSWQDSEWSGGMTDAQVWPLNGYLYPASLSTFGDIISWGDLWVPDWVSEFTYLSNGVDLGALYHCELTFAPVGSFLAGNPTLEVHYATVETPSPGDWAVWHEAEAAASVTTVRKAIRHFRLKVTVPQAGVDPCYVSGLNYSLAGPKYSDQDTRTLELGWQTLEFNKPFPQPPSLIVSAHWNAEQTLTPQYRNITETGFDIRLVQADLTTEMNGVISYIATAR